MKSLQEELDRITVGNPTTFRNLTVFPLLRPERDREEPEYLLAEDALAQGTARITELGEGGSVPELRLENDSGKPVLLFDGEELTGAKQNRVLTLTILARPGAVTVIPVSCVEARRWHRMSDTFKTSEQVMYARARAAQTSQVSYSMRSTGTRRSDQRAIWHELDQTSSRMSASSPTGAMSAVFAEHAEATEEFVRAFDCAPHQAGVAFWIGGKFAGLDLLDHPRTLRRLFPKLVRGYALDAVGEAGAESAAPEADDSVQAILDGIGQAENFTQDAAGLGVDVRFHGAELTGAALWERDRYVHISAFPKAASGPEESSDPLMSRLAHLFG